MNSTPSSLPAPCETDSIVVSCDGGDGLLGHPLIYLNLMPKGHVTCPYCSQQFVYKAHTLENPRQKKRQTLKSARRKKD